MRRNGHPSFPSAITCCFFSSLKTLLMPREPIKALLAVNVLGSALAGFQVTLFGRIWVTPEATGVPVYLRDLVDISRAYQTPMRYLNYLTTRNTNGEWHRNRAITLAVQMRSGEQIDRFGTAVDDAL